MLPPPHICCNCLREFREENVKISKSGRSMCSKCIRKRKRKLYRKHKHQISGYAKKANRNLKLKALQFVSKQEIPTCVCGCDNIGYLELNLINGGHSKLIKEGKMRATHGVRHDIIVGKINANLFNVRCRACNSVDHIEFREGKKLWTIKYNV